VPALNQNSPVAKRARHRNSSPSLSTAGLRARCVTAAPAEAPLNPAESPCAPRGPADTATGGHGPHAGPRERIPCRRRAALAGTGGGSAQACIRAARIQGPARAPLSPEQDTGRPSRWLNLGSTTPTGTASLSAPTKAIDGTPCEHEAPPFPRDGEGTGSDRRANTSALHQARRCPTAARARGRRTGVHIGVPVSAPLLTVRGPTLVRTTTPSSGPIAATTRKEGAFLKPGLPMPVPWPETAVPCRSRRISPSATHGPSAASFGTHGKGTGARIQRQVLSPRPSANRRTFEGPAHRGPGAHTRASPARPRAARRLPARGCRDQTLEWALPQVRDR
jgi:hypothetical protein